MERPRRSGASRQLACKPDSVVSSHPSAPRGAGAEHPAADLGLGGQRQRPCLALHRVGFALHDTSPCRRCALTAPFHPCRRRRSRASPPLGGFVSVALSRGFPRVGFPDHPALRCPDFPRRTGFLSDPPRLLGQPCKVSFGAPSSPLQPRAPLTAARPGESVVWAETTGTRKRIGDYHHCVLARRAGRGGRGSLCRGEHHPG